MAAAKAEAAEKAAVAAENGSGAGPIDEAVVHDNDVYEVRRPVALPPAALPLQQGDSTHGDLHTR